MAQLIPSPSETKMGTVSVAQTNTCLTHTQERNEAGKDACRRRSRWKTGGETSGGEGWRVQEASRIPTKNNNSKEQKAGGGAATEAKKGFEAQQH